MENTTDTSQNNAPQLTTIELRVLGVLMEKQLTTPDQYPLTLNSVITACNQKSSREPVSNYTQGEVARALQSLDDKHFVRKEHGARAEKYTQQFMHHLALGKKQQALLCVMMLRGPQSVSELNTRTQRMCEFSDRAELEHCLERLCLRDTPYAVRLAQQAGQRGERVAHLFHGAPDATVAHSQHFASNENTANSEEPASSVTSDSQTHEQDSETIALLEMEIATLTQSVNALNAQTAELQCKLNTLYKLTGHSMETP